ncbi:uncharacterized protein EAE97_001156 [Botrytis byssoidea]|uniref:Uncharacterized protein n=1 Tax=Botrytis byssoidea TaxID=139641 RepID=A0A9P5ITX4_9HELO|nr:uncharacterized protein EAE97_001156 [Botrytis byssoidea]KAF7953757.1 hypothetical protein EAE97_001156 [Botrytis byssoidea]
MPADALVCSQAYRRGVKEPSDEEIPQYEWEEFDRYLYRNCSNYKRYLKDKGASAGYLAEERKKEVKEEAKKVAIMLAFDQLSSDEQDIFLTGKIQRGSGNECQKSRNLDDDFEELGI